jgi:hypothetical protein
VDLTGWFEIALGLAVPVAPRPELLVFVFLWKLGTEALRPLAAEPWWEFIERGGGYAAPLALLWLQGGPAARRALRHVRSTP